MNIPNALTLFRLFLIPIFILFFFSNIKNAFIYSIFCFLIAGFSDVLDGYIARRWNLITECGIVLDPLADKLMLITVLSCLVIKNYIPVWISIIIITKEIFMVASGSVLFSRGTVIPSNIFGKISTLLFYVAVFVLIFNQGLSYTILYLAVISAIVALINYIIVYVKSREKNYL